MHFTQIGAMASTGFSGKCVFFIQPCFYRPWSQAPLREHTSLSGNSYYEAGLLQHGHWTYLLQGNLILRFP
jgi:hypothetical protein